MPKGVWHPVVRTLFPGLRSALHHGSWVAVEVTWIGRLKAFVNKIAASAGFYRIVQLAVV